MSKILLTCDKCKEVLEEPGGLLFGPPDKYQRMVKYHICIKCYCLIHPFFDKYDRMMDSE